MIEEIIERWKVRKAIKKIKFPKIKRIYAHTVDAKDCQVHPEAQKALNKRKIANEVLDNIVTIDAVLNGIPVIKIKMKSGLIVARPRKLKSKYTVEM